MVKEGTPEGRKPAEKRTYMMDQQFDHQDKLFEFVV